MDTCPACGARFVCNPGDCWCEHLPVLDKPEAGRGCYCEQCLAAITAAQERSDDTGPDGRSKTIE